MFRIVKFKIFLFLFLFPYVCFAFSEYSIYNLDINFLDRNGSKVNIKSLSGKVHVFSMIYTNCKTICPIILSNMRTIEKLLPTKYLNDVVFTLVTLDPDRDDVSRLNKFFLDKKFNEDKWFLYRTSKEETLKLALTLGIKYKKEKSNEYIHSNLIIILDKEGVVRLHHQGLDKNFDAIFNLLSSILKY